MQILTQKQCYLPNLIQLLNHLDLPPWPILVSVNFQLFLLNTNIPGFTVQKVPQMYILEGSSYLHSERFVRFIIRKVSHIYIPEDLSDLYSGRLVRFTFRKVSHIYISEGQSYLHFGRLVIFTFRKVSQMYRRLTTRKLRIIIPVVSKHAVNQTRNLAHSKCSYLTLLTSILLRISLY